METIRERIARLLEETEHPLSAEEIAGIIGLDPHRDVRVVYEHIRHVSKTVFRRSGGRLQVFMVPPRCRECGYVFRLETPRKPSKCPRCGSQRIEPPRFIIMKR